MKKVLAFLLAAVICVSLVACGASTPKTIDDAIDLADEKIEEWDSKSFNGFEYSGSYDKVEGKNCYFVVMQSKLMSESQLSVSESMIEKECRDIDEELSAYFDEVGGINVIIAIGAGESVIFMYGGGDLYRA